MVSQEALRLVAIAIVTCLIRQGRQHYNESLIEALPVTASGMVPVVPVEVARTRCT